MHSMLPAYISMIWHKYQPAACTLPGTTAQVCWGASLLVAWPWLAALQNFSAINSAKNLLTLGKQTRCCSEGLCCCHQAGCKKHPAHWVFCLGSCPWLSRAKEFAEVEGGGLTQTESSHTWKGAVSPAVLLETMMSILTHPRPIGRRPIGSLPQLFRYCWIWLSLTTPKDHFIVLCVGSATARLPTKFLKRSPGKF